MPPTTCVYGKIPMDEFGWFFATCCVGWTAALVSALRSPRRHTILCLGKALSMSVMSHAFLWTVWASPLFTGATNRVADVATSCILAFECCDLLVYQLHQPKLDRTMIFHHLLHIVLVLRYLGAGLALNCHPRPLVMVFVLQETSSVFLSVRALASPGSRAHELASVAFAVAFLTYRNVFGWVPLYMLWRIFSHDVIHALDTMGFAAAFALQLYWGGRIFKNVVRRVHGRSSTNIGRSD